MGLKLMLYSPFILYMYTTSRPQHQTLKPYMYYVNYLSLVNHKFDRELIIYASGFVLECLCLCMVMHI